MITMYKHMLTKHIKLTKFNSIDYAACLFPQENDTILFMYKYNGRINHIFNLSKTDHSEELNDKEIRLTKLHNVFTIDEDCKVEFKDKNRDTSNFENIAAICRNSTPPPDLI